MKEIGILFSAPMVRANRAGLKSQTRRTRGLDKINEAPDAWEYQGFDPEDEMHIWHKSDSDCGECFIVRCAYGVTGDRLWTRETFSFNGVGVSRSDVEGMKIPVTGDGIMPGSEGYWKRRLICRADGEPDVVNGWRWFPSIFMPRWASRDSYEVVSVRPERLQSITEADAIAEGAPLAVHHGTEIVSSCRQGYIELWDSINGPGSWAKNPWAWRIEYKNPAA